MRRLPLAFVALCAAFAPALAGGSGGPPRVVSLNLCADELVLRLADQGDVASVTWLAHDPAGSNVWREAAQVGINHGLAEQVLMQEPDLVIAGLFTTRTTVAFLRRVGTPIVELGVPQTLDAVYTQIGQVAEAVGHPERGAAMVADMRDRLAKSAPYRGTWQPRAFVLRPNGFTVGPGSLVDAILTKAGLANVAAEKGMADYGQIPLETLIMEEADILIVDADERDAPALATELLRHPALQRLGDHIEVVALPSRLWTCAGPMLIEAVERLAEAAERLRARRAGE